MKKRTNEFNMKITSIQKIFKHFQVIQLSTRFSALSLSSKRFIFETIIIVTHSYQLLPCQRESKYFFLWKVTNTSRFYQIKRYILNKWTH